MGSLSLSLGLDRLHRPDGLQFWCVLLRLWFDVRQRKLFPQSLGLVSPWKLTVCVVLEGELPLGTAGQAHNAVNTVGD